MKVLDIETRTEHFPLTRPYAIAGGPEVRSVENVIVVLRAEGDLVGLGAASPAPEVTGETIEMCRAALDPSALDWLIGRDLRELPAICRALRERAPSAPAARTAIDIALHDAFARSFELPLCDLLGRAHSDLLTSITIGIRSVDATLEEADEYVARGFRALKVKIGDDLDADVRRLERLRDHIGADVAIRVDANQGYGAADLTAFCARTAELDLELIEQPLAAAAGAELRALPAHVRSRIAADESLLDERDALALTTPDPACGIFNIKLMKCGGIFEARRIAAVAESSGVDLMWGCMDESAVSIAAALHVALASPATRYLDLDGSFDLAADVATGGFVLREGRMATTRSSGLGTRLI